MQDYSYFQITETLISPYARPTLAMLLYIVTVHWFNTMTGTSKSRYSARASLNHPIGPILIEGVASNGYSLLGSHTVSYACVGACRP